MTHQTPQHEPAQVRRAVQASIKAGEITVSLAKLVHKMAKRRCSPHMCEDCAQHVLLGLHKHLGKLNMDWDVYHYVASSIVKSWQQFMRTRRREQRQALHLMGEIVDELPSGLRSRYRSRMISAAMRMFTAFLAYFCHMFFIPAYCFAALSGYFFSCLLIGIG